MTQYEYKIVPVPQSARRADRTRKGMDPIAATLQAEININATEGWEYCRTDRVTMTGGMLGRRETRDMLVFRKASFNLGENGLKPEERSHRAPVDDGPISLTVDRQATRKITPRRLVLSGDRPLTIAAE